MKKKIQNKTKQNKTKQKRKWLFVPLLVPFCSTYLVKRSTSLYNKTCLFLFLLCFRVYLGRLLFLATPCFVFLVPVLLFAHRPLRLIYIIYRFALFLAIFALNPIHSSTLFITFQGDKCFGKHLTHNFVDASFSLEYAWCKDVPY